MVKGVDGSLHCQKQRKMVSNFPETLERLFVYKQFVVIVAGYRVHSEDVREQDV